MLSRFQDKCCVTSLHFEPFQGHFYFGSILSKIIEWIFLSPSINRTCGKDEIFHDRFSYEKSARDSELACNSKMLALPFQQFVNLKALN